MSKRLFQSAWLLAIILPALGQSGAELATDNDLKVALHDVLAHANLFDAVYLSNKLGIGLHISAPQALDRDVARFEGTATSNPPVLYGSIQYEADVDRARQRSSARVSFGSKSCGSLRQWGSEWNVKVESGMSTDGGPSYETLAWPGSQGINLTVFANGAGCNVQMVQNLQRVTSVQVSPELSRVPANLLSNQIADLLLSDLRDFAQVGRVLNTEFVVDPDSQRNGLLYKGRPFPARVITGFKPYLLYDGDDSGWFMPGAFFARPLHIGDRSVSLDLTADREVSCLSQPQLVSDLRRRDLQIHQERGDGRTRSVFSVRTANRLTVFVTFEEGCATGLRFLQTTDVARSLGDPIRFEPKDSLDRSKDHLTNEAERRVNLLVSRVRHTRLEGIEIVEMPGNHASVELNQDLKRLKGLIGDALEISGVTAKPRANSVEVGTCGERQQPEAPAVCVDVWQ